MLGMEVPLGNPIGNGAPVPFKSRDVNEFLVALTREFKLS
jgi:hypothetical protein